MSLKQTILHVNDVDLNVIDTGSGAPALVFLHYWGGSSRTWAVPVHVIAGADDSVEPEASLRASLGKVLPHATFSVLPGVGHMAPLEAPARLAEAIRSAQAA